MEDDTSPVPVLHGLLETNVHQHGAVERVSIRLVDDVDAEVQLLPPVRVSR